MIEKYIDNTWLGTTDFKDLRQFCIKSIEYGFYGVCIAPYALKFAKEVIKDKAKLVCVVGFPYAFEMPEAFLAEAKEIAAVADEIDIVMNLTLFRSKRYKELLEYWKAVCDLGKPVKVIIETPALSKDEIVKATRLVLKTPAEFVKTGTGKFGPTKVWHVKLIKSIVKNKRQIKASGGIFNLELAKAMLKAGANRIGTSHGFEIVDEERKRLKK